MVRVGPLILAVALLAAGCCPHRAPPATRPADSLAGLSPPMPLESVDAVAFPPTGWRMDPLKTSPRHNHQVWVSPTGDTAYGIIRAQMPLPVGPDLAILGFLAEMRRTEGDAALLSKQYDPALPGVRFIAEGGRYRLRVNLQTRGFTMWAVYAGALRAKPDNSNELPLAERAREATSIGGAGERPRR